jgi:hypothetical protein
MLDFGEFTFANAQVGQVGRAEINERAYEASRQRHPKQALAFRRGRIYWSWCKREAVNRGSESQAEWPDGDAGRGERSGRESLCVAAPDFEPQGDWSFRLPLVKDGVEWGWVNFYRSLSEEALLVDTNYLSDLFRREFTEAAARILTLHEEVETVHDVPETAPVMAMQMAAKG